MGFIEIYLSSAGRSLAENQMDQSNMQMCVKFVFHTSQYFPQIRESMTCHHTRVVREKKGSEFCDSICLNWSGAGLTIFST
jgi:hypothetical protein